MRLFLILFWFGCYSAMITAMTVAMLRAFALKSAVERSHALLLASFGIIMVGSTLGNVWSDATAGFRQLFGFLATTGVSIGIYATPAFALSLMPQVRQAQAIERVMLALAVADWVACALLWNGPARFPITVITFFLYAAVITSVSAIGLVSKKRAKLAKAVTDPFWDKVTTRVSILTLCFVPALVAFDFFGSLLPYVNRLSDAGFRFYPVLFVLWSLNYLALVFAGSGHAPGDGCREGPSLLASAMDECGLSPREREVAKLLVCGRSYKEIAAELGVSAATAKTHVARLYVKTGCGSKIEVLNRLSGAQGGRQG